MIERKNDLKTYTNERGKFAPGNPGRPAGACHKVTRAVEELLEVEVDGLTPSAANTTTTLKSISLIVCLPNLLDCFYIRNKEVK